MIIVVIDIGKKNLQTLIGDGGRKPSRSVNKKFSNPLGDWWKKIERIIDRKNLLVNIKKEKPKHR